MTTAPHIVWFLVTLFCCTLGPTKLKIKLSFLGGLLSLPSHLGKKVCLQMDTNSFLPFYICRLYLIGESNIFTKPYLGSPSQLSDFSWKHLASMYEEMYENGAVWLEVALIFPCNPSNKDNFSLYKRTLYHLFRGSLARFIKRSDDM